METLSCHSLHSLSGYMYYPSHSAYQMCLICLRQLNNSMIHNAVLSFCELEEREWPKVWDILSKIEFTRQPKKLREKLLVAGVQRQVVCVLAN